ncbi:hypothetical protein DL98DRAFT_532858 [Cadophora sp. DSE1049]|nr:hypothetical protein DL98DRAFT_532858 [Cadophora sp. DSE1049]
MSIFPVHASLSPSVTSSPSIDSICCLNIAIYPSAKFRPSQQQLLVFNIQHSPLETRTSVVLDLDLFFDDLLPTIDLPESKLLISNMSDINTASFYHACDTAETTSSSPSPSSTTSFGLSAPSNPETPNSEIDDEVVSPMARALMDHSSPSASTAELTESIPPLDKFTLFPKLPLELRFMVWRFALYQPQVVGVICSLEEDRPDMTGWEYYQSIKRTPVIRFVCKEAREEALKLEIPLITYMDWIARPTILTIPAVDTVLLLEKDFECEFGLWQMLADLVDECYPTPIMPAIAVHLKWRSYFNGLGLEDLQESLDALKCLGTKEVIFVVGDEAGCRAKDVDLGHTLPVIDPEILLEADLVGKIKDELKMKAEEKVTWEDLEKYDLLRVAYAKEICESDPEWTVTKITYREVAARV